MLRSFSFGKMATGVNAHVSLTRGVEMVPDRRDITKNYPILFFFLFFFLPYFDLRFISNSKTILNLINIFQSLALLFFIH
jgi:hypothetical protein